MCPRSALMSAENARMGMPLFGPPPRRIACAAAKPSTSGMRRSISIRSNGASTAARTPASPPSAVVTSTPIGRSSEPTSSRFAGLSSTASTRRPASTSRSSVPIFAAARAVQGSAGISNQKVDPCPSRVSTPISPPIASTRPLQIARPSPVPPCARVVEASTCENRRNSLASAAASMPAPVSRTSKRIRAPS